MYVFSPKTVNPLLCSQSPASASLHTYKNSLVMPHRLKFRQPSTNEILDDAIKPGHPDQSELLWVRRVGLQVKNIWCNDVWCNGVMV
jgi:hypothetical protein